MNYRLWIAAAAIAALVAVAAGALGAHALRDRLTAEQLESFHVAVRYQMTHALALLAIGWLAWLSPRRLVTVAGLLLAVGMVLFSGSIYGLVLLQWKWLGPITPIGGVLMMAGWLSLAIAAFGLPTRTSRES